MKSWFTPFLALGALLVLAGCQNSAQIISNGLRVALTKIERTADGEYQVYWQVENPNVVAYVVDRSEHKLYLDGVLVGTVSKKTRQGVPVQNKSEGVDPLVVSGPAGADKLAQVTGGSPVSYRVESSIWVLLQDDDTMRSQLTSSGSVAVVAK